jgi:Rrf2 family transcriptional regulator, repressor of oqxAB
MSGPVSPGWFAVAVQALALLARSEGVVCPSATLADSLHAHAVYLRRVLGEVVRAGIVEVREGREGGYRLARPPERISLAEVYRALKAAGPIDLSAVEAGPSCPLGPGMRAVLEEIVDEAEQRVLDVLERHTIAEVAERAAGLSPVG